MMPEPTIDGHKPTLLATIPCDPPSALQLVQRNKLRDYPSLQPNLIFLTARERYMDPYDPDVMQFHCAWILQEEDGSYRMAKSEEVPLTVALHDLTLACLWR